MTNPPLDAIREKLVTSLASSIGPRNDLLTETPEHCRQVRISRPVLTNTELSQIQSLNYDEMKSKTLPMLFTKT